LVLHWTAELPEVPLPHRMLFRIVDLLVVLLQAVVWLQGLPE